jgi:hypothetical protein
VIVPFAFIAHAILQLQAFPSHPHTVGKVLQPYPVPTCPPGHAQAVISMQSPYLSSMTVIALRPGSTAGLKIQSCVLLVLSHATMPIVSSLSANTLTITRYRRLAFMLALLQEQHELRARALSRSLVADTLNLRCPLHAREFIELLSFLVCIHGNFSTSGA